MNYTSDSPGADPPEYVFHSRLRVPDVTHTHPSRVDSLRCE